MKMKKFINSPDNLTDELLDGLVAALLGPNLTALYALVGF